MKNFLRYYPSPFDLALILTLVTAIAAFIVMPGGGEQPALFTLLGYWYDGFWGLLAFAMQMVMILVLGHVIALAPSVRKRLERVSYLSGNSARAAAVIAFVSMTGAWVNWGLGLIMGAVMARKVAEISRSQGKPINYPLLAAAGYAGLMIWHGGLSGSAPLKVAEEGHFLESTIGLIHLQETILSTNNLLTSLALIILGTLTFYLAGKRNKATPLEDLPLREQEETGVGTTSRHRLVSRITGLAVLVYPVYVLFTPHGTDRIDLNFVITILFGAGVLLHPGVAAFSTAAKTAITGATGIILQFPIYAGIMGLMEHSGLTHLMTEQLVSIASPATLPLFVLLSSSIVNFFIPSGGGQWAVQGPILMSTALALNSDVATCINAFAYGDELTNMIQPFWALPLLGITGVKARDILPYSALLMLVGTVVFVLSVLL